MLKKRKEEKVKIERKKFVQIKTKKTSSLCHNPRDFPVALSICLSLNSRIADIRRKNKHRSGMSFCVGYPHKNNYRWSLFVDSARYFANNSTEPLAACLLSTQPKVHSPKYTAQSTQPKSKNGTTSFEII